MRISAFITDERGTVTVDWALLAAGIVAFALSAAAVLNGAIGSFSEYNERDLALDNAGGRAITNTAGYVPQNSALYAAYLDGLTDLSIDELDAIAGYANRLHASGYMENVAASSAMGTCLGGTSGAGTCDSETDNIGASDLQDFLTAVDAAYQIRGESRPTHTHINSTDLNSAMSNLGVSTAVIDTILVI